MSKNARVVKWLNSLYRGVLRRQRVSEAQEAVAGWRRALGRLRWQPTFEPLEQRLLLSATTLTDVPRADYLTTPTITTDIRTALTDGVNAFATQLNLLAASPAFSTDVPGVLQYVEAFPGFFIDAPKAMDLQDLLSGSGINLGSVLTSDLAGAISAAVTVDELNVTIPLGGFLSDDSGELVVSNAQLVNIGGDNFELRMDISITFTDEDSEGLYFDLGRNADQLGIRPTNANPHYPSFSGEVNVEAGFSAGFRAGVYVTITEGDFDGEMDDPDTRIDVVDGHDDFFIRNAVLTAHANADSMDHFAGAMQFGFLDVSLKVTDFDLDADIALSLDGGGEISFANLGSIDTTRNTSGNLDADIDITIDNIAGFADDFAGINGVIHFTGDPLGAAVSSIAGSGDPRTAPQIVLNADADNFLRPFRAVDAGAIVGMLESLADRVGQLPASSVLNLPVPLTDNTTIGQIFPLASIIKNALVFDQLNDADGLVDDEGNPQFSSAQTLTSKLAGILGVAASDIAPTFVKTDLELLFTVEFDADFDGTVLDDLLETEIGFDLDLGDIAGLSSEATVSITPTGHITFTFGVDLAAGGSQPIVLSSPLQLAEIRGVVNAGGDVQTPDDGVLTQAAAFKLTIGGGFGGTANVTLSPADTAGHTTLAELVALLQTRIDAALTANSIDIEPQPDKPLITVGQLSDGRLTISSPFTNILSVRSITGDGGGFANQLGFLENQQASTSPTPVNGILGGDGVFDLRIGTDAPVTVTVAQAATLDNTSVDDLVEDINDALTTAGVDTLVVAERAGVSSNGVRLRITDAGKRLLQVTDANDVIELNLGWQDEQITAEIAVIGRNELVVTGDAAVHEDDFEPGADISFNVIIDGGDPIAVNLLQNATASNLSNTAGNGSLNDLVADLNFALSAAQLPDGRSLATLVTAGAIDTDRDAGGGGADAESLTLDTIVLRSTREIGTFDVQFTANGNLLGFAGNKTAESIGPAANGQLPGNATFTLTLRDLEPVQITVNKTDTDANSNIADLVADIQASITAAGLGAAVIAGRIGNRVVLTTPDLTNQQIRVSLDEGTAAGGVARNSLGLQDNYLARADEGIRFFVQDASIEAALEVGVTDASVEANLGFVAISIGDTEATLSLDLSLGLFDHANATDRIFLDELDERLTQIQLFSDDPLPANGKLTGDATFDVTVNGFPHTVTVPLTDPDGIDNPRTGTATNNNRDDLVLDIQQALDAALAGANFRVSAGRTDTGVLVLTVSALQAETFSVAGTNTVAMDELHLTAQTGNSLLDTDAADWTGSFTFGGINVPNPIIGLDGLGAFSIPVTVGTGLPGVADLGADLASVPAELLDFADLLFSSLDGIGIEDVLLQLSTFLTEQFGSLPFVSTEIPVIGLSIADLLDVADSFQDVAEGFTSNPTATVQELEERLAEALGLPSLDPEDLVQIAYDGVSRVLLLDLTFAESFNRTLPVDFDLGDYAPSIPFDLRGNASLQAEGSVSSRLAVGIDLTNPSLPALFLDTTKSAFEMTFAARGTDLNFVASLGPAGLFVSDGLFAIDADGDPATTNDPMTFNLGFVDDGDGRYTFGDPIGVGDINATVTGALNATLPVFFPTDADVLGDLKVSIANLEAFMGGDTSGVNVTVPDLSNIFANLDFNLLDNLPLLIDGIDFILGGVQDLMDDSFGSFELPLIGGGFDDAAQFIDDLRANVFGTLRTALDTATESSVQLITDALTAALGTTLKTPVTPNELLTGAVEDQFVEWTFDIGGTYSVGTDFGLGLPALGLESDGAVTLALDWNLKLGFGLDFDNGFYFTLDDDTSTNELSVGAKVYLPDVITGNLVFLRVDIEDSTPGTDPGDEDASINFAMNLEGAGGDGKLTLSELGDLDADVALTGGANIDVHLNAGIGGGGLIDDRAIAALPSIVADFVLDWDLTTGTLEKVAFEDVGLDLGSFFSDFLKPVVAGIQQVTDPLQPFIDVLTAPIPVISDLAGEPFTLLDLAALFGDVDTGMIEAVANIITLINTIPTGGVTLVIPFGSVVLVGGGGGGGGFDLFDAGGLDEVRNPDTPLSSLGGFSDAIDGFGDFTSALTGATTKAGDGSNNDDAKELVEGLNNGEFGDFIEFPFLNDPSQILGALFGRPFVIVTLDLPPFSFGFSYSQFFPIIGPLGASITGSLGATFDFAFGYDSFGLQKFAAGDFKYPLDMFRGFFISDGANADGSGADVNEVEITGSLVGAAELNLGVAKGGVGGGVEVTFGFNLDDPDSDGRVRIEEIVNNLKLAEPPFNPLGIFDLNVKVEAFLTWFIEVLFVFEASGTIGPSIPLLDETITIPKQPVLGTKVSDDGVLRLNAGPFSADRLRGEIRDVGETLFVKQTDGDSFAVWGMGVAEGDAQTFDGITRVEVKGGQGNDTFTFIDVSLPMLIDGGNGDDTLDLTASSGPSTITGGSGNDNIKGGSGVDTVDGGAGMDIVVGNGGADLLRGGDDDDTIGGGADADMIFGDAGGDKLGGGDGDDYIDGGSGADTIYGDSDYDMMGVIVAAVTDGQDTLSGGNDKDKIYGEGGNDKIGGGAAADLIEGGLGADTLYGDSTYDKAGVVIAPLPMTEGGDRIYGEAEAPVGGDGDDTIFGEAGNDFIRGNDGNDTADGSYGADIIFGDAGNDNLKGGADGDIAFGGADDDTVAGEGGSDVLFGDDGLVVYTGFPAFTGYAGDEHVGGNRLIGDGDQTLAGGAPNDGDALTRDLIITDVDTTTDGNDIVTGAAGDDIAFGGAGDDNVIGDIDPAAINVNVPNPVGDDLLFGDGGKVLLSHRLLDLAATVDPTFGGNDTMYGNDGDDVAFGGFGDDTIDGGHGEGITTSGSDQDVLIGDSGSVDYVAGLKTVVMTTDEGVGGIDTIHGNEGRDIAMGGAAGDFIHGNLGDDVLIGDEGRVEITNDGAGAHITLITTNDTLEAAGGIDDIEGDEDDDVILGGVQGDKLKGTGDDDIILGDEGQLIFNLASASGGDDNIDTLDLIETTDFNLGGNDMISGAADDDVAFGGSGADTIFGDNLLDGSPTIGGPGSGSRKDILIGDQGRVEKFNDLVTLIITTDTADADGGVDHISGNEDDDVILGGVLGDLLDGNAAADIILGDEGQLIYNLASASGGDGDPLTVDIIETLQPNLGGSDTIQGNASRDIAFGGAAGDLIYGDADLPALGDANDILFGDGGRASLLSAIIHRLESTDTAIGGEDYIEGNAGDDIALGGAEGDEIHGDAGVVADIDAAADGDDMLLGDNGLLNWLYSGDAALAGNIEQNFIFETDIATLDLVTTLAPNDGGMDEIFGNAGDDGMFGGTDMDLLVGDNTRAAVGDPQFGEASARPGQDLQFGDHGRYYPQHSYLPDFYSRNFFAVDIGFTDGAAGDLIYGNEEDDVLLGQQGDDRMFGGSGDDDMIGGHNLTSIFADLVAIDEFETPEGTTINDFMDGGTGDDAMAGDNAIIWRNGATIEANDLRLRFRTLEASGTIYDASGLPNVTAGGQNDPRTTTTRTVFLLDHDDVIQAADAASVVGSRYGNDVMAGDAGDDALFGQLGNDLIQGDGSIHDATFEIQIFEGVVDNGDATATLTDGHDYIEGNGGADMLIGNLGQDDILGGSSDLFGLDTPGLTDEFLDWMRPDGGDIIFGGAATAGRIERHAFTGDVNADDLVFGDDLANRHAVDSDMILGDNGRIFRIVTAGGELEQFAYDQTSSFENRGDVRIVVRAFEFLDYSPFDLDVDTIGGVDVIHGESGDDFIHGQTADDILFGDAEDDDIYGERGGDWMSGGTGDDGMIGDNGLILTSRNSVAEPLYGVVATIESFIETPGDFLMQPLNVTGELKKTVDLEPFGEGGDDVMYGGLGSDWMHGGMGNDGMSGAEALPDFYNDPVGTPRVEVADIPDDRFTEIRIVPRDGLGVVRTGFYDFTNALAKLDGHFLNFENDLSLMTTIGTHFNPLEGDGDDKLYGVWGNDWLVGGTGRDHLYGGLGNDIHQGDDDLETNGGLNNAPDNGNLIPGPTGGPAEVYDNSDISFGGGGRDLLIGNTGADRAEDWIGETNAFQAPFAPFGNGHVERQVPPHTFEFFYALSESDGADQTRIGNLTGGFVGDPARNGEPFAELGLITQKDREEGFSWLEQSGAPTDKQAGNTPGGKRDTRGDGLNGGTKNVTATTSATVVIDLNLAEVVRLSLASWAERLSGLTGMTMSHSIDVLVSGSINGALVLDTNLVNKEFSWVVVPL